ncbi:MAG: hypothetical protein INF03_10295 [Phenylobacterium sp.]|nr:hypothetical protein [Phenylobacterium sp.]
MQVRILWVPPGPSDLVCGEVCDLSEARALQLIAAGQAEALAAAAEPNSARARKAKAAE